MRSMAVTGSANVMPAKVNPANPSNATDQRRNEAVRNIKIESRANTINPVVKNIPILTHQSTMNPMRLSRNAIPPNITIDMVDIRV